MSLEAFINNSIQSIKNYHDYVDAHNGAVSTVHVIQIERVKKNIYSLRLDDTITNEGAIRMRLQTAVSDTAMFSNVEKRYINGNLFSILETTTNRMVTLKVSDELDEIFQKINYRDISFISDMKFLIENVKKWYSDYGIRISTPSYPTINDGEYFFDPTTSSQQKEAIENALSSNISYVWGPPGTGKTQVVLSDCILSYLEAHKRVLIVAPTNAAVENTLRTLISFLQSRNQSINCLYRMGMASRAFAQEYGEICESRAVLKAIEELQHQLDELRQQKERINNANKIVEQYENFNNAKEDYDKSIKAEEKQREKEKKLQSELEAKENELNSAQEKRSDIEKIQAELNRKEKNIFFKSKLFFSKQGAIQHSGTKEELCERHESYTTQILNIGNERDLLKESVDACGDEILKAISAKENAKQRMQSATINIIGYFDENDLDGIFKSCECAYKDALNVNVDSDIESRITEIEEQLRETSEQVNVSLEKKHVFAFTVDYLISHYKSLFDLGIGSKLSHVFLDEAAYCPFIKAAPLFSFNVPVTFFGDHMQLPPICEASDNALASRDEKLFLWDMSSLYFPQLFETDYSLEDMFTTYQNKTPPRRTAMLISVLSKTFRFGDNLATILDRFVYKTGFSGQIEFDTKIIAIHARMTGNETFSRENIGEVQAIREYLLNNPTSDVAVLTPYKSQRQLLINRLHGILDKENISTVHAAQGKEWDTVIISVSDTDKMYFTDTLAKKGLYTMNTAISRAKRKIVLVCDCDFWGARGDRQLIGNLVNNATETIR